MTDRFEIVPFHQHQIMTLRTDDAISVIMRPIVETLGLDWSAQYRRVHRHPVLSEGIGVITIPSASGMQKAMTLNLEQFHGWLITLTPDRVRDEAKREMIVRYQREAFRVVFEHFHGKVGRPDKPTRTVKSLAATISTQNQVMKLISRLQVTCHPQERRSMHKMLDDMCQELGIDTPDLDQLGCDAPVGSQVSEVAFNAGGPVVEAITDLMAVRAIRWEGTPTELLTILSFRVPEAVRRSRAWPPTPAVLGSRIARAKPLLHALGILVERHKATDRSITLAHR